MELGYYIAVFLMFIFQALISEFIIDKFKIEMRLAAKFPGYKYRIRRWLRWGSYVLSAILAFALFVLVMICLKKY